jgi:hypothetical protein
MWSRRQLLVAGGVWSAAPFVSGCSSGPTYDEVVQATWRHAPPASSDRAALLRTLVRYATLAPSSHNTQCWRFRVQDLGVQIEPDLTSRCPVVDPDDHHVFVSLGCAAENLVQAAAAHGLEAHGAFEPSGAGRYVVSLTTAPTRKTPLFDAIPERQSTRGDYDGQALSTGDLRLLEEAGTGPGVRLLLLTERQAMEEALEYVVAGNTAQMNDDKFVRELTAWIRFSRSEAVSAGDGLFSGASGNPNVPRWVGRALMGLFFTVESENDRYARQVRNAAGIAVFIGQQADPAHWVEVGRCYERFALQATALGVRNAFLNQPVEVGTIRPQFASWLGVPGQRPDLVVRFGRGPKMPASLRRPVEAVLV